MLNAASMTASQATPRAGVNDNAISLLNVVNGRIPRVQLDGADLHQTKEAIQAIDPEPNTLGCLALFYAELMDSFGNVLRQRTFVVKGRIMDMPHQLERAMTEMRQRLLTNALSGEFFLFAAGPNGLHDAATRAELGRRWNAARKRAASGDKRSLMAALCCA